jgi:hypothetical protein
MSLSCLPVRLTKPPLPGLRTLQQPVGCAVSASSLNLEPMTRRVPAPGQQRSVHLARPVLRANKVRQAFPVDCMTEDRPFADMTLRLHSKVATLYIQGGIVPNCRVWIGQCDRCNLQVPPHPVHGMLMLADDDATAPGLLRVWCSLCSLQRVCFSTIASACTASACSTWSCSCTWAA